MSLNLSNYQVNLINAVANENGNVVGEALAGSGKTFTLVLAVKAYLKNYSNHKVACIAFNKSIANELVSKFNDYRVRCCTSHSLGYSAILNYVKVYGGKTPLVTNDKFWKFEVMYNVENYSRFVTKEQRMGDDDEKRIFYDFCSNVDTLQKLARVNLIKANEIDKINELADTFGVTCLADEVDAVAKILTRCYDLHIEKNVVEMHGRTKRVHEKAYVIDYVDMLTFGAMHADYCSKFNLVCGDECQDFNMAQHCLIENSLVKGGKWFCVGDRHQAINGFCGALNNSFDILAEKAEHVLPLSVNYRCGTDILDAVRDIVPNIEPHEGAIQGNVEEVTSLQKVQQGDFILCRKKAPLVAVAMKFLKIGRCAIVLGNDLGANLQGLIAQAVGRGKNVPNLSTNVLMDRLNELVEKTEHDMLSRGFKGNVEDSNKIIELKDKVECIDNISIECQTIGETIAKIKDLFTDEHKANAVTLMTCHKSKGLESDNVFVILPNKLPLTWKGQLDWQYQQELNLRYVAYTRAKKNLYIVDNDDESFAKIDIE